MPLNSHFGSFGDKSGVLGPFGPPLTSEMSHGVNMTIMMAEISIFEDSMDYMSSFGEKTMDFMRILWGAGATPLGCQEYVNFAHFCVDLWGLRPVFNTRPDPYVRSIFLLFFFQLLWGCVPYLLLH